MNFRQFIESFRGWLSPDGGMIPISAGDEHDHDASERLDRLYPNWEWWENPDFLEAGAAFASPALQSKDWVRIVSHGKDGGIYSVWNLNHRTKESLRTLLNDLNPNAPVRLEVKYKSITGTAQTVYEKINF